VIAPVSTTPQDWATAEDFLAETDPREVSPLLRILLTSDGSMTTLLEALRGGRIDLDVVRQGEEPVDDDTARRLGVRAHDPAITRHVWLTHAGRRLVYAVSVLPIASLSPSLAEEIRRGVEPLGRLLDACGRPAVRDGLRIGRIHNHGLADALGAPPSDPLWCRRYRLAVEQVMTASIFEVFSPRLAD
jgi:chorismate-pyruvate lyase